jgi:hypothetical protein
MIKIVKQVIIENNSQTIENIYFFFNNLVISFCLLISNNSLNEIEYEIENKIVVVQLMLI